MWSLFSPVVNLLRLCVSDAGKHAVDEEGLTLHRVKSTFVVITQAAAATCVLTWTLQRKLAIKVNQEICFLFPETMFSPTMSVLSNW